MDSEPPVAEFRLPPLAEKLAKLGAVSASQLAPNAASKRTPTPRRNGTVSRAKSADNTTVFTGKQRPGKRAAKPATVNGYVWRADGSGWELRQTVTVDGKRKQPYVAHLSKSAYADMRRRFKGDALDQALLAWVTEKIAAKENGAQPREGN